VPSTMSYTQTSSPLPAAPVRARLMIVSSLGSAGVPMTSGRPKAPDFDALWNTLPAIPSGVLSWSGWTGNTNDITVQRINLSPLFVNLWLSTYNSSWSCGYSIDSNSILPVTGIISNYFIQNSVLNLYYTNQANVGFLDSSQILIHDSSFVFYGNEWLRSIGTNAMVAGTGGNSGGGTNLGSYDFSGLVNGFLAANPTSLTRTQQTNVVQNFIAFMNAYNAWAAGGFIDPGLKTAAHLQQAIFQGYLDNLVGAIPNNYQSH
jgi:hypothetical protein